MQNVVYFTIASLLLMWLPESAPNKPECFTHRYIQLGKYRYYTACYDGDTLNWSDTGTTYKDSTYFRQYIQPKIGQLKR